MTVYRRATRRASRTGVSCAHNRQRPDTFAGALNDRGFERLALLSEVDCAALANDHDSNLTRVFQLIFDLLGDVASQHH